MFPCFYLMRCPKLSLYSNEKSPNRKNCSTSHCRFDKWLPYLIFDAAPPLQPCMRISCLASGANCGQLFHAYRGPTPLRFFNNKHIFCYFDETHRRGSRRLRRTKVFMCAKYIRQIFRIFSRKTKEVLNYCTASENKIRIVDFNVFQHDKRDRIKPCRDTKTLYHFCKGEHKIWLNICSVENSNNGFASTWCNSCTRS